MIQHLALIMDGNRRWAKKQSLLTRLGHRQGAKTAEMAIAYCLEQQISYLSLYTFSLENLKRSQEEVLYLFSLIHEASKQVETFVKAGVCIRIVGDCSFLPQATREVCRKIEEQTAHGAKLQCNLLLCYGGQQEILAAAQDLIDSKVTTVSKENFIQHLWLKDCPDPDAIIRTGGVKRLSNFLLFQAAYSEIRFLDCLWPELSKELLHKTVLDCLHAQKNVGK